MSISTFENIIISGLVSAIPNNPKGISEENQTASDLAFEAANKLLSESKSCKDKIGVILFLSTTPDYRSPATAMVLQKRLEINPDCIAFDINSGGCGFLHGLQVGAGLLNSISKDFALVLFGDTSSKQFLHKEENKLDYTDAASAVLLRNIETEVNWLFMNKTKSEYYQKLILKKGGYREAFYKSDEEPLSGLSELAPMLIDSDNIFRLQEEMMENVIGHYLQFTGKSIKNYDYIFFDHNTFSNFSRIKEKFDIEKYQTFFNDYQNGHTRGSFLPLLLEKTFRKNFQSFESSCRILLVSFGEGLTVTVGEISLDPSVVFELIRTNSIYTEGFVSHEI